MTTLKAWAVLNKEGKIRKHKLHGHFAIYENKGDADTSTAIGKVVECEVKLI